MASISLVVNKASFCVGLHLKFDTPYILNHL